MRHITTCIKTIFQVDTYTYIPPPPFYLSLFPSTQMHTHPSIHQLTCSLISPCLISTPTNHYQQMRWWPTGNVYTTMQQHLVESPMMVVLSFSLVRTLSYVLVAVATVVVTARTSFSMLYPKLKHEITWLWWMLKSCLFHHHGWINLGTWC